MSQIDQRFVGLRIAVVGPFPPRPGELSDQSELLCRLLESEGARVERISTDAPDIRTRPRVGIHLLPLVQAMLVFWRLLRVLPRCQIVHVQAASSWGFYLPVSMALLLGKLTRRRVVISYFGSLARTWTAQSWRLILPWLRRADAIAASSAYAQEIWQRYGPRVAVIPPLITVDAASRSPRTAWPPLILWLDELERRANPVMPLQALALLQRSVPAARLLMVGEGALAEEVRNQARALGVADAVAYRATLTGPQRHAALRAASIVWRTASEDNLPSLLLQAAASGAAIVATDVGGVSELLDDGVDALLLDPQDVVGFAQATARVLGRPFLAESLTKNAHLAVERCTWPQQRHAIAKLYGLPAAAAPAEDDLADDLIGRTEFLWSDPQPDVPAQPAAGGKRRRKRTE